MYDELTCRINQLQQAADVDQYLALIRPSDYEPILERAISNSAVLVANELQQAYQCAARECGRHAAKFRRLAGCLPTAVQLQSETQQCLRPFLSVLNSAEREYNSLISIKDQRNSACFNAGATIGAIGGALLGPLGAIVGGAIAGMVAGNEVDEQLRNQGERMRQAFQQLLVTYDSVVSQATNHLAVQAQSFYESIENAKADALAPPKQSTHEYRALPPSVQQSTQSNAGIWIAFILGCSIIAAAICVALILR